MTYYLVCHRHFFFLYRMDSEEITLLDVQQHWEPLITLLKDRKATKIAILDHGPGHILKIETTNRVLALHEYAQWYWQKWCHIRQNSLFVTVRMLRRYNSILIAASPSNSQWMPLLEKLDQYAIAVRLYSYPMALVLRIHGMYSAQWASLPPPLLVIVDRESHVLLAFLLKGELVFLRHHILTLSGDIQNIGPKNMIMDTLRYLEKTFKTSNISPIFFLEDLSNEDLFRGLFPNSVFHILQVPDSKDSHCNASFASTNTALTQSFDAMGASIANSPAASIVEMDPSPDFSGTYGGAISSTMDDVSHTKIGHSFPALGLHTSGSLNASNFTTNASKIEKNIHSPGIIPAFDRILLSKIPRMAMMHLQGTILQNSWARRLGPYIRLINVLAILIGVYSLYTALSLMNCNQKLGERLDQLHGSFKTIQAELEKMPISSDPIVRIQAIRKHSEKQYKDLLQHFALLEHVLNDRCVIRMISISPKKTRLSLQITDPTMMIDDLIDMGQNALSDFCVTLMPSATSSLFIVETKSPFFYEKTTD